jgi:hypothetical protein
MGEPTRLRACLSGRVPSPPSGRAFIGHEWRRQRLYRRESPRLTPLGEPGHAA